MKMTNPNPSPIGIGFGFILFGALGGTRTPDPLLRRQLLYPPELQAQTIFCNKQKRKDCNGPFRLERVMGIEPTQPAWKAGILAIELHPHTFTTAIILTY